MKRIILPCLLALVLPASLFAFNFTTDLELRYDINAQQPFNQYLSFEAEHETDYIDFFWKFSVCNDRKYQPSHGEEFYFGYYFFLEDGGVIFNYENLSITAGRTRLGDQIDSPYSLFVSSKIIPALTAELDYDDGTFFYTSRWTELNRDSALTDSLGAPWPDRGWQHNSYGIYLGDFKLGFQDSLVYTGRSFDPEYFLNPLPGFFKQYVRVSPGKPWQITGNDNSIMGFFLEYEKDEIYAYGQFSCR